MTPLLPWLVCSPEYGEVDPIVDGQGPLEFGCDTVFVEAATRSDARLLGVKLMRQQKAHYLRHVDHPFEGVRVLSKLCPVHATFVWVRDHYECSQCAALLGVEDL